DRPARPGGERFDRPATADTASAQTARPAVRPGVERFDTGLTRRSKP
ncbi:MAG TPA: chemoreceptor glutamine deamidase CheD, partial [Achromobacter sp.]|nr:chemoreceptor glutamine deamidase CheD [Achromobacter sp.]